MANSGETLLEKDKRRNSEEEECTVEPLDLQRIAVSGSSKTSKTVPAMSLGFMEPREYVSYIPLPSLVLPATNTCSAADEEEWIQRMIYLEGDMMWILRLPHHRFWSQVVYDESLQKCLQTYLSRAPRSYEINFDVREEILEHQNKVHKLVFLVFLRMSTYKESKMHYITPSAFGDMVYDNFLFDIPRMLDLCVLYGFKNQAIIAKMIDNLFSAQAKFMNDLDEACSTTMLAFDSVEEQLQILGQERSEFSALTNGASNVPLDSVSLLGLLDIVNYITDISATLYMFLECFPKSSSLFLRHGASTRIPHFYDSVLTDIQNECEGSDCDGQERILEISIKRVAWSKTFFIKAFRNILCGCIQEVLNAKFADSDDTSHMIHLESYLQVISEIIIGTLFKYDYNQLFPIAEDLELFEKAGISLDPSRIDYILRGFTGDNSKPFSNSSETYSAATAQKTAAKAFPTNKSITNLQDLAASLSASNIEAKGAAPGKPEETILSSQIQYIYDVFPELGEGYIEICLEYYNYDSAKVIDALLTGVLPAHLYKLDTTMKRKVPSSNSIPTDGGAQSMLTERRSIFDNDEFDVFNREDLPMDRIHFGKSNKTANVYELLNDAKDSAILKEFTLKYAEEPPLSKYEQNIDLYDDEYDDTYDSTEVSVLEHEAEDELLSIRPFTIPRVLSQSNKAEGNQKQEEDVTEEPDVQPTSNPGRPREWKGDFCENPELTRQRYQQRQEARQRNRNHPPNTKTADSSNKTSDYHKKERHKATGANHNRRKQGDFKRSRGMMPS